MTKEEVEKLWMDNPESMQFLKNIVVQLSRQKSKLFIMN